MHPATHMIEQDDRYDNRHKTIKVVSGVSAGVIIAGIIFWGIRDSFLDNASAEISAPGANRGLLPQSTEIPHYESTPLPESVLPGEYTIGPWRCLPLSAKDDHALIKIRMLRGYPEWAIVPDGEGPYALHRLDGTIVEFEDYGTIQNLKHWSQPREGICILKPSSFELNKTLFKADSLQNKRIARDSAGIRAQISSKQRS